MSEKQFNEASLEKSYSWNHYYGEVLSYFKKYRLNLTMAEGYLIKKAIKDIFVDNKKISNDRHVVGFQDTSPTGESMVRLLAIYYGIDVGLADKLVMGSNEEREKTMEYICRYITDKLRPEIELI